MTTVISGDTGIDKVQDGSIETVDIAAAAYASQAEAEVGTENTKLLTALRVKQAITAQTPAPAVLQIVTTTDAGSSTSSTSLTNISIGAQSITPISSTSDILVEVTLQGYIAALAATNVQASFQLYDYTNSALIGGLYVHGAVSGGGGTGLYGTVHMMASVPSTGTTMRQFAVYAKTSNASAACSGTLQKWKFTEIA